jgi:hypothetical protein
MTLGSWLTANPGWGIVDNTIRAMNGPLPGRFTGIGVIVPSITTGNMAVASWMGSFATFDAAAAANSEVGVSGSFSIKPGNPAATPIPDPPASTLGLFPGMTLAVAVIPEPSSLALAGLGAAALLIFRRRK